MHDSRPGVVRPVVVGVDGSTAALDAVRWAVRVAADRHAPLVLCSAASAPAFVGAEPSTDDELRRILDVASDAARHAAGTRAIDVTTASAYGTPAGVLVERSADASLIVVGTRGLGEFTGGLSGSVSTAVATHATCAVTVVPSPRGADDSGSVVVGVDGTDNSVPAVRFAYDIASSRGVELVTVHAWSDIDVPGTATWTHTPENEEASLAETLAGWAQDYPDVTVRRVVVKDRPVRELVSQAKDASLIVVGRRGRGGFTSLLLGSTSRAVLHSVEIPVTVVPSPI